jgi:hypothetical protein
MPDDRMVGRSDLGGMEQVVKRLRETFETVPINLLLRYCYF